MYSRRELQLRLEEMTNEELNNYAGVIDCLLGNHRRELKNLEVQSEEIQNEIFKRSLGR